MVINVMIKYALDVGIVEDIISALNFCKIDVGKPNFSRLVNK
jgi:hypothetical protein